MSDASAFPGCSGSVLFLLNGHDLFHPALMPPASKRRSQPFIDDAECLVRAEDARTQRQNIGIIVLAAHLRLIVRAYVGGPDAINFVCGNGHANAAATDQNAQIGALLAYIVRHGASVVRV